MNRKKYWFLPFVGIGFLALGSLVVMLLWNNIIPDLIPGVKQIGYWQSLGLLALCRILFGNMGSRGGGWRRGQHNGQGQHWRQKWRNMSEEEKIRMREDWKKRCGKE
jgi:hypothetical protein